MDHRVLIIGGSGMLGHEVFAKFQNIFNVVSTSFNNKNNSLNSSILQIVIKLNIFVIILIQMLL